MNAREDQTDSHAIIKSLCCCSQDATNHTTQCWISGANTLRSSTASTPKKTCEHTKDGVYIAKVMYVAKGEYSEYAKDGMYIADSKHNSFTVVEH
jgi:hypothetical protein